MAGSRSKIIDLSGILSKYYNKNVRVINKRIKQLNKPSSFELTATIKIQNSNETEIAIYFMKVCERDSNVTLRPDLLARFKNEVELYETVIPAITDFQISKGILPSRLYYNIFPARIGARISINPNRDVPDDTGVLLLENLNEKGYITPGAKEGLDIVSCKIVLVRMAHMHVAPLVMRHICKNEFEERVVPTLMTTQQEKNKYCRQYINKLLKTVLKSKKIAKYSSSITQTVNMSLCNYCIGNPYESNYWMTLCHPKLYNKNFMIAYDNRRPIACKILGLKNLQYSNCINDLIFFLFTSVNKDVLQESFNYLAHYYFQCIENIFEDYRLRITGYTISDFHKELDTQGPLMLVKILETLAETTCNDYDANGNPVVGKKFQKRLEFVLELMISRGWFKK
ncbi:uncharacterized protein LOC143194710 [Rhynchophorus ferrugineus]|uniref:CHK kinase-like domain-containing protein n=1 Tax=Rhynchophorus ferrugineus TaxID=354439 RepID=A0A834IEL7_RHYFE|nr:hypothetical protein GWI33_006664 [Rhynchophorus ferrugineus]